MNSIKSNNNFFVSLKSMFKVDLRRMFKSTLLYIVLGISFFMPVLILVMTSSFGGMNSTNSTTEVSTMEGFVNVWQAIGTISDSEIGMDLTTMCNINLVFFMITIFVCIFVSEDFRSGYFKNLFTIRAKKTDYVLSKTIVCFFASVGMLLLFFGGSMIGGAIAGLPFVMEGFSAGGIICSMFAKIFLTLVFISISLALACVAKQKLWLSILGVLGAGMLFFMMIPMITPLNSSILNVMMCLVGGSLFTIGFGYVGNLILNKFDLV